MQPLAALQHGPETPPKPGLGAAVERVMGMLWYEMLSELNQTGLSEETLGPGGGNFQSLFLWQMAEQDFGKYDAGLTAAALRQIGGAGSAKPAPAPPAEAAAEAPGPAPAAAAGSAAAIAGADTAETAPADLISQAKAFARTVWPQVSAAAQALGVPAVAVLAQAALETGWGSAVPGNNLFGIKAAAGQPSVTRPTHEVVDGVLTRATADFRLYADIGAAIGDYVGLIQAGYAGAAGQASVAGFAQALQDGGYATDPAYAAKLTTIAHSPLMRRVLQSLQTAAAGSP